MHHVDGERFHGLELDKAVYQSRDSMVTSLGTLLSGEGKLVMEYSPLAAILRASKVDAGTVELVRGLGVEIVSSADLLQYATQRWGDAQLLSHIHSAAALGWIVRDAFQYVGSQLSQGPTEYDVAQQIRRRFTEEGLTSADGPIVAVNEHGSDPHYQPKADGSSVIREGDWLLIDLWAKEEAEGSVYADITWVAYVGSEVPPRHQEVFDVVADARDAALGFLEGRSRTSRIPQGWEVDTIARDCIARSGYGDYFTHRLGHSLGQEVHGEAVNLDGFETQDTRSLLPGIGFTIEPGVYLPEFGVRSEIDVFMTQEGPITTTPVQREVVLIPPP